MVQAGANEITATASFDSRYAAMGGLDTIKEIRGCSSPVVPAKPQEIFGGYRHAYDG